MPGITLVEIEQALRNCKAGTFCQEDVKVLLSAVCAFGRMVVDALERGIFTDRQVVQNALETAVMSEVLVERVRQHGGVTQEELDVLIELAERVVDFERSLLKSRADLN